MSQVKVSSIVDTSGGNTVTINGYTPTLSNMAGRNRIINGDMRIDQRNNGASVDASNTGGVTYTIDRWAYRVLAASKFTIQRNAGSVTPPAGFTNYLGCTSSSAYSVGSGDVFNVWQAIEGFNTADLAFGTSSAQAITLSFWVRSSLTGTFSGAFRNGAANRSYVFTYTISSANTWEQKTITIPGDSTGTWATDNSAGLYVQFSLGVGSAYSTTAGSWQTGNFFGLSTAVNVVGTSGATFYITGVQLEAGSVATPFERRPYGTELALCQRYYFRNTADQAFTVYGTGQGVSGTLAIIYAGVPVSMRTSPTVTGSTLRLFSGTSSFNVTGFELLTGGRNVGSVGVSTAGGLTAGQGYYFQANNNTAAFVDYSAEL